jgi:L-malate glycosyltransferase
VRLILLGPSTSVHIKQWANQLAVCGHDVEVVTLHARAPTSQRAYRVTALRGRPPTGYLTAARQLRRLVEKRRPEIIHAHYATGYGTLARRARIAPLVVSVWGSDVYDFPLKTAAHRRLVSRNLANAQLVCSTSVAMTTPTLRLGVPSSRLRIVPFGVDPQIFSPAVHEPDGPLVIGTVKALEQKYGVDTLLKAFALLLCRGKSVDPLSRGLELVIAGGGSQQQRLKRLAEQLGIVASTRFLGPVPHRTVPELLRTFHVFAALSRASESFGVALVEAAASGLPVVASDVGGLPEVVTDGVTGLIVPSENPQLAADGLAALLRDPNVRQTMGAEGRARATKRYSWAICVEAMESVYREVRERDPHSLPQRGADSDGE